MDHGIMRKTTIIASFCRGASLTMMEILEAVQTVVKGSPFLFLHPAELGTIFNRMVPAANKTSPHVESGDQRKEREKKREKSTIRN